MARMFAALSALCSLGYLVGVPTSAIFFFRSWKVALIILVVSVVFAFAAKMFDRAKMRAIYGTELGDVFTEADWANGKRDAIRQAHIDRAVWDAKKQERDPAEDNVG